MFLSLTFLDLTIWRLFSICVAISWSSFTEQEARFCPINFLWKPHFQNQHNSLGTTWKSMPLINNVENIYGNWDTNRLCTSSISIFSTIVTMSFFSPCKPEVVVPSPISEKSNEIWPPYFQLEWHNTKGLYVMGRKISEYIVGTRKETCTYCSMGWLSATKYSLLYSAYRLIVFWILREFSRVKTWTVHLLICEL